MARRRCSILLILMMVITPIASAFNQCAVLSNRLSVASDIETIEITCQKAMSADPDIDKLQQLTLANLTCYTSAGCILHVCVDCGIDSFFLFPRGYSSYRYGLMEESKINSLAFSPEIRPPIHSL